MNTKEFIEAINLSLTSNLMQVDIKLNEMDKGEGDWEIWYQIKKDLQKAIDENNWTIGLIEDGII
jgi:hypothetical protein